MTTRLADLRSRLQQLEAMQHSGELTMSAYDEARATLEREIVAIVMTGDGNAVDAVDAVGVTEPASDDSRKPSAQLIAGLVIAVLLFSAGGYALTGSPGLARLQTFGRPPSAEASASASSGDKSQQVTREQIEAMVERLAQRMKDRPDDAQGWLMLARAYSILNRPDDALPAYSRAATLRPDDANTLTDYADAIALHHGGQADAQTDALIAKALELDPTNLKALALAGTAAFERADYTSAIAHWQKMANAMPANDPERARVEASIADARQHSSSATTPTLAAASAPASRIAITGTVNLASSLIARAAPNDVVFIFARAVNGSRMPLAIQRARVKDLPLNYRLDDSMSMAPTAKLSDAAQVIVSARISKSGNAMPQVGDLSGDSPPVKPGADHVAVVITTPITTPITTVGP